MEYGYTVIYNTSIQYVVDMVGTVYGRTRTTKESDNTELGNKENTLTSQNEEVEINLSGYRVC
jgi:hypothetical protein